MYEFTILNKHTNEENIIFGHSIKGAFEKHNLNRADWEVILIEYID